MNSTRTLDKQVAKILYGDSLVFSDNNILMATSQDTLCRAVVDNCTFADAIRVEDEESFCLRLPEWSTEMGHAWELVKRMLKVCDTFSVESYLDRWIVRYETDTKCNAICRISECEAICECFIEVFKNEPSPS